MTPKEYKQMMDYLTRSGVRKQVKFASDIARPDPKPIVKEIELFNAFNRRNPMAGGGMLVQPRNMYAYAGIVKQGPNKGKHKYTDFYPKKTNGSFHEWFNSKKEMNEALQKRKEESGRGLTEKELTKKYKKEIEKRGYKTWGEVPENLKRSISTKATPSAIARGEELPRFKKEGLSKRLNEKTRKLLETKKPINPKTGLPYTVKEYTDDLTPGQKMRLNLVMQGKKRKDVSSFYVPGSKKKGFYPEKDANRLINYMKIAADQQKDLPIKERTFINVFEDKDKKRFIGVQDVRKNTLYTHVDYNLGKPGAKKGTVITKHPDYDELDTFFKVAKKFKYERPEKLLGSYFKDYERVPTYNEIYKFFTTNRNASVKTFQNNALTIQHQKLIGKVPTQNFQLLTNINNSKAAGIMRQYNRGDISKAKADYELKKIGARQEGLGILQRDITPEKGLASAKKEAVKLFKDAYKVNPKIVEDITQKLKILGGGKCGTRGLKNQGGRVGLQDGTPSVDVCVTNALERIRKGGVDFTKAETMNFNKLTKGLRAAGASNIVKFGILPEVLLEGALIADKMASEGDSFAQGLRNSYLAIPFQALGVAKTYEEGEKDRILAAAPESERGKVLDVFNLQDKLNKKFELMGASEGFKRQIAATDAVSDGPLGYVGDSQDLQKRLFDTRADLQDLSRGDINRAERMLTSKPIDLNIQDQLTMDAFKSATEKADADKASNILVAPGTGFGVDAQIRKRMKELPVTPELAKKQLQETGDFFGIGYTPFGMNQLLPLLGQQNPRFGFDETGKYNEEKGLNDFMNYLRNQQVADAGGVANLAGGGIAKLAGVDSGPPPESGPMSQGLQGLMKRVRNL